MVGARPLLPLPLLLLLPAAAAKEYLFVTLFSNHSIMRMELDGSNPVALVTYPPHEMADPKAYVSWPDGVQVDVARRKMYWTNMGDTGAQVPRSGSVWRSNLDGSGIEVVVPVGTIGSGKQCHLDAERQQLYVADKQAETAGIWRIDLAQGPPFRVYPLLQKRQPSASGVTLDHTGERVLLTSDGQGHPSGLGVMGREVPRGESAANRSDVRWIYTTENPIDVETDSRGNAFWSDGGGISPYGIRRGSVDGTAPARTIQTKAALKTSFPVGVSLTADEQSVFFVGFGVGDVFSGHTPGYVARSSVHGGDMQVVYTPANDTVCATGVSVVELPDEL